MGTGTGRGPEPHQPVAMVENLDHIFECQPAGTPRLALWVRKSISVPALDGCPRVEKKEENNICYYEPKR